MTPKNAESETLEFSTWAVSQGYLPTAGRRGARQPVPVWASPQVSAVASLNWLRAPLLTQKAAPAPAAGRTSVNSNCGAVCSKIQPLGRKSRSSFHSSCHRSKTHKFL